MSSLLATLKQDWTSNKDKQQAEVEKNRLMKITESLYLQNGSLTNEAVSIINKYGRADFLGRYSEQEQQQLTMHIAFIEAIINAWAQLNDEELPPTILDALPTPEPVEEPE